MCAKGFGQSQPTKIDKLIESAVRYCHKRRPEALDSIFDYLPVNLNQRVVTGILAALQKDIDTLSWFCGYMASEINGSEDNQKPHHPIAELSKTLIKSGMEPFADFMPYPGCRIVILNSEKFESLPESVQAVVQQAFDIKESTGKEAQRINDALLQELVVQE
ncbi:hypothetical protein [Nostoc sp. 'Peltigera membranacea cyanobiont' N6]|uniref:hypothetical protein n=1 Tax=Nostoc sp. 'Peltigera membranacea cyanobiont' N6 TaxID=1261031 RepID=UPI000CF35C0C|nr:hypothetical protein [Nostoc sp. 'Peltigera membranacea cyanobiont' N6]AVH66319.1 hypothetical protein NPM_4843 [Nostoc sp. 'Peltigera membranacea cyanobiont' N6]